MRICKLIGFLIVLSLFMAIFVYRLSINTLPKKLTIATGQKSGVYYHYALKYKEVLKDEGINLEIVPTNGSPDALNRLYNKEVDLAFIQGGVAQDYHNKKLSSLGSVFYEPLWVFYNDNIEVNYLSDLKNKKVSVGPEGSGTKMLFETLLKENGIDKKSLFHLSTVDGVDSLLNKKIDALCMVVSSESKIIKKLLSTKGIKLMSFKRAASYKSKFEFMNYLQLTQGLVDLRKNVPQEEKTLLVTTASIVVNENVNYNLQRLILKKIRKIHLSGGIFEPRHFFPSKYYVDIPISKHAATYLDEGESWAEKYLPFWFSSIVEALLLLLVPLIPILFIIWKFILPSYKIYLSHSYYLFKKELRDMDITQSNKNIYLKRIDTIEKKIRRNCLAFLLVTNVYHDVILEIEALKNRVKDYEGNRAHIYDEDE